MKRSRLFLLLIGTRVALARERKYSRALEAQLEGEKQRNQGREDELITIGMRVQGLYGVATREHPAPPREPLRRQIERPVAKPDAWATLTDDERREWPVFKADADPDGTNTTRARREFLQMIEFRRGEQEIM